MEPQLSPRLVDEADIDNWLFIPSFHVRPEPPYDGFSGYIKAAPTADKSRQDTSRLMLRSARQSAARLFDDIDQLWVMARLDGDTPDEEASSKELCATTYHLLVFYIYRLLRSESAEEQLAALHQAVKALSNVSFWAYDATRQRRRKSAKLPRPPRGRDATPEEVARYASGLGYRARSGLKYDDFVEQAAKHFGVAESLIHRRYSQAKSQNLLS